MTACSALTPEKFVFLRDQQPLTPQEWAGVEAGLAYARQAHDQRDERVRALGLDPEVWLPAANWDRRRVFYRNFEALYDRRNVPLLRIYAQQFTGYRLCSLGGSIDAVPGQPAEELDERFAALQTIASNHIEAYCDRTAHLPEYLHVSPPTKFGEVGWQFGGKLVNHDTVAYLERLALLYRAGLLDKESRNSLFNLRQPRILEIGGGYGGLAYFIKQVLPKSRYTIVDLPESLAFSGAYLAALFHRQDIRFGCEQSPAAGKPGCTLLPNYEFPSLVASGASFDLVINTLSLSEMSERQIRAYCEGISRLIGRKGYFFEQNQDNRHLGLPFARNIVQEYFPYTVELGGPSAYVFRSAGQRPAAETRLHLAHGFAHVWANRPIPPRRQQRKIRIRRAVGRLLRKVATGSACAVVGRSRAEALNQSFRRARHSTPAAA
jgi:putative sugar O-methyltransferase